MAQQVLDGMSREAVAPFASIPDRSLIRNSSGPTPEDDSGSHHEPRCRL
jgi:hypothetical protein